MLKLGWLQMIGMLTGGLGLVSASHGKTVTCPQTGLAEVTSGYLFSSPVYQPGEAISQAEAAAYRYIHDTTGDVRVKINAFAATACRNAGFSGGDWLTKTIGPAHLKNVPNKQFTVGLVVLCTCSPRGVSGR